ncbi:fused MFS/spermidine synthase [Pectinatus frisingensis]|uniref:fused MFS/spermidine synthase n=1 Tax=Pectinatus frisingensis TaxID=865 RepID=UPI001E50CADF|nr:fused MFS/spermidine synthase [Pectinatus frisingensis]
MDHYYWNDYDCHGCCNYWGGRSADAHPDPDRLYVHILVAAVWISAIPLLGKYIILGISGLLIFSINTQLLTIAAFLTCMVIFVFPLVLLGTVIPSLAKYATDSMENTGKTAGMLGAYNTIESILGTFLPTFLTIPTVGTAVTFLIFSGILLLVSSIYFLNTGIKRITITAATVLFVVCSVFGNSDKFAFWETDLLYEGESVYNYLQVRDRDDSRILSTNVLFGVQSIMKKNSELTGMYYDYALAAPIMAQIPKVK